MTIHFTKMHGIGNDYIYVDCTKNMLPDPAGVAIAMSPRHFSVGSDGLVLICPSEIADANMRMFNADGSEGKMCGNAIRCVGKFLFDHGLVSKTTILVETKSGTKRLTLSVKNGEVAAVRVNMGKAELAPEKIPVTLTGDKIVGFETTVGGEVHKITCVSMGNPHNVIFTDDPYGLDLEKIGPGFENDPLFPERVNTEFVRLTGKNELTMRVWERGSGETWACGTGATAVCVATIMLGHAGKKGEELTVIAKGGTLKLTHLANNHVILRGPAVTVFEGVIDIPDEVINK